MKNTDITNLPLGQKALEAVAHHPLRGTLARQMAACNMAAFMGQNADDLIGRFGIHQGADIDENLLAIGDKSIEGAIADQKNARGGGIDIGGTENRRGIFAHQLFDFCITNDVRGFLLS